MIRRKREPEPSVFSQNHQSNFLGGLILGALIGAGAYYFLTQTEEGRKVKTKLKEKAVEKGGEALDNLNDLVDDIEQKGKQFQKKAKQVQTKLEAKAKDVQQEAVGEVKQQLVHIKALRERGRLAARSFTRNGKSLS